MNSCQNYLDQYVCDNLTLRVLFGDYDDTFESVFYNLRQHEKPHIIIIRKCGKVEPEFSDYREIQTCHVSTRTWYSFQNMCWNGNMIFREKIRNQTISYILLKTIIHYKNDMIIDAKKRFTGQSILKWSLDISGNVFYSEARALSNSINLLRIYTNQAKQIVVRDKLPLYVIKPNSIKGRFLFHLTEQLVIKYSSNEILDSLSTIKKRIYELKGSISMKQMKMFVSHPILKTIINTHLVEEIENGNDTYIMTPRGNYLLFYSSSSSSSNSTKSQSSSLVF